MLRNRLLTRAALFRATTVREWLPAMAPNHAVKDLVALPALSEAKLRLYEAMRSQGVRKADLARRIVWHKSQMDQIETALKGLHLRLAVQVEHCAA